MLQRTLRFGTIGLALCGVAGCKTTAPSTVPASSPTGAPATAALSQKTKEAPLKIASDIERRVEKFAKTKVDFDENLVAKADRVVLTKLVAAAEIINSIYLDQVSADNHALRARLVAEKAPAAALDYFDVMAGPWDRLVADAPFIGEQKKPLGAGFYPKDMTQEEFAAWLKAHPEDEKAFHDYFTIIERQGDRLVAVPYSKAYGDRLAQAATLLEDAAQASSHPALKRFLSARAKAFLSNDYFESDMAWMDLGDSPIEVVIGPYEVYEDRLMGYKAAFEAFITLRDPEFSARLQKLSTFNEAAERALPLATKHWGKRGSDSPISVVIELLTAGESRSGVQAAAFNLPNDERVRTQKGSKKVMLKNVTEAKFSKVLMPIAERLVDPEVAKLIAFDPYFTDILLHEVAHGMGPGEIVVAGRKTLVNRELKELYPAIEECKADIVGLVNGAFLVKKKALPAAMARQLPAAYLAGFFRAVRFGTEEAHAKAVLLGFNYLRETEAIIYNGETEHFSVDYAKFDAKVRELAGKLLLVEANGNYDEAKELLERYGQLRPEVKRALDKLTDLPVDIRPEYTVLEKMKAW